MVRLSVNSVQWLANRPGVQSGLGLGPGSSFLDAAVASGSAPAKAWGLWVGSRSVVEPVEGALWIGGYDTSRVADKFTDFTTYPSCPTCVIVTNITYEHTGGSASLFSNDTETLLVALEPYTRSLNVPQDVFLRFANASGGTVGTDPGTTGLLTFPLLTDLGNLSITLKNGYQTTIPSDELFLPPRAFNKEGIYNVTNSTYLLGALANSTEAPQKAFDWGIPYLVMNYMVLDYDQKLFRMAPAVQGPFGEGQGSLVEPLCKGVAAQTTSAAITPSPTKASATATATPVHHNKTNVGAIAGGVVGGVLGLALVAIFLFLLLRSGRKERAARTERDAAVAENVGKTDRVSQVSNESHPRPMSQGFCSELDFVSSLVLYHNQGCSTCNTDFCSSTRVLLQLKSPKCHRQIPKARTSTNGYTVKTWRMRSVRAISSIMTRCHLPRVDG